MDALAELNLKHLHALVAVHVHGGISAAAPRINLFQPALTQAIARLERQLDAALFDRQPGGMSATEAALLLVPRVERALGSLARGVRLARRAARLPALPALERRLTLSQLRALTAVDTAGSYTLAAARAGLSQPAMHRAVRDLEAVIEVPLLLRRGKTLQATPAATRLLRQVRLALSELAAGVDELAALRDQQGGRLAIGVMPLARAILLPQALARFARAWPGATVNVVEGPFAELLSDLREGGLDLLVGAIRDLSAVPDVVQEGLFDDDPVIVGRSGHPLAGQARLGFDTLLAYPWVIPASGAPVRARWERMFRENGHEPPALRIECGSVVITRGLLLEDDWLTLMSRDQFVFECRAGVLTEIGLAGHSLRRRIGLTTRADWHPTRPQRAFLQTFREVCAERSDDAPEAWPFRYP
ncbi:MAG: HTH-type transcriptional regulator TsaR [Stenotrophomonas maltophilia]|uniref:HTH-type transcriptional regulator TsaR n=1 Tax=Stenotrophomonas maltophilia TaxID=40324 RepID=A0A7V8FJJ7_STEMA|nr:MAG: HTH-type transcriptional regulator TsaR [Stenotrophomonas maltophilia]